MRSSAPTRCRRSTRFLAATPRRRNGLAVRRRRSRRRRRIRRRRSARLIERRAGHRGRRRRRRRCALTAADNAAGALTVKVLRAQPARDRRRHRARARPQGPAARRSRASPSRPATARPRRELDSAGRNPQRHRAARNRRRALRRRRATARQALAPAHRRRRHRRDRRYRAAAARLDLLSHARARRRSPTCGSASAARRPTRSTSFIDQHLPMLILADVGNVAGTRASGSRAWIEDGGVLVRFAGPRLAAADDDLVPVKLRRGGRMLGGSLTWEKPQPLAAFSREGPFAGMAVPNDVTVNRQVLAEPDADARRAHLGDARRRHAAGHRRAARQGHDRAVPRHRRYALVGSAAVGHLRRDAASASSHSPARPRPPSEAGAERGHARDALPPTRMLDGFGAFGPPPPTARPVPADLRRPRHRRPSARLLRPAGRTARGEHARRRPTGSRRSIMSRAQRAARGLSP